jgi:hypothetical protein
MTQRRRMAILLLSGALALAAALWLTPEAREPRSSSRASRAREAGESMRAPAKAPLPSQADFLRMLVAAQAEQHEQAKALDREHPHPITRDHERLYRDVDLLHAADEAIQAGAFDRARALLTEHHRELAGMSAVEEEGLWLLADCAEHTSAENVERVRSFYEEHTDSTVRRRLRRACLERAVTD